MPKIQNVKLAGILAGISTEMVQFDEQGIGEIKSQEVYESVLELADFFPVEEVVEEPKPEEKPKKSTKK